MKKNKLILVVLDIIEIIIPILLLIIMFAGFLIGIFSRYVLRNPQSWTYELCTIAFVSFTMLSASYVHRKGKHIVFDMLYIKMSEKVQCLMRIVGNIIVAFTCAMLVPASIKYISSMKGLTSQIIHLPRGLIFACFPVVLTIMCVRTVFFLILDIKAFTRKTYKQTYAINTEEVVE